MPTSYHKAALKVLRGSGVSMADIKASGAMDSMDELVKSYRALGDTVLSEPESDEDDSIPSQRTVDMDESLRMVSTNRRCKGPRQFSSQLFSRGQP